MHKNMKKTLVRQSRYFALVAAEVLSCICCEKWNALRYCIELPVVSYLHLRVTRITLKSTSRIIHNAAIVKMSTCPTVCALWQNCDNLCLYNTSYKIS